MEHIILSNLGKYVNPNNILYDLQFVFYKKRSSKTQLIQLVKDPARNLTSGKQTDLILLYFSMAFDKVNHFLIFALFLTFIKFNCMVFRARHFDGFNPS